MCTNLLAGCVKEEDVRQAVDFLFPRFVLFKYTVQIFLTSTNKSKGLEVLGLGLLVCISQPLAVRLC